MTHRAMELLALPEDESAFLLDIGCGSGLSGEILDEYGHVWVGCDIAPSMLGELQMLLSPDRPMIRGPSRRPQGYQELRIRCMQSTSFLFELTLSRSRSGARSRGRLVSARYRPGIRLPTRNIRRLHQVRCHFFSPSLFTTTEPARPVCSPVTTADQYSISVIQWLLNADATSHSPQQRLTRFFTTLHASLKNPSRAVFQFYPSSDDQVHMITSAAQKAGFGGGLVVDYPNSRKARKMYLVLMVGSQGGQGGDNVPKALDGSPAEVVERSRMRDEVQNEKKRRKDGARKGGKKGKKELVGKEWIMKKKELYRTRGKEGCVHLSYMIRTTAVHVHAAQCSLCILVEETLTTQGPTRLQVHSPKTSRQILEIALPVSGFSFPKASVVHIAPMQNFAPSAVQAALPEPPTPTDLNLGRADLLLITPRRTLMSVSDPSERFFSTSVQDREKHTPTLH